MSVDTNEELEPQDDTPEAIDPTVEPMISTPVDDVEDWLNTFGMGKYADVLHANGFDDMSFLRDLTLVEIQELIKLIEISSDDELMFIRQMINLDIYVCLTKMQKMHKMEILMKDQELNHMRGVIRQTNILLTDAKRKNEHALEQVASYKRLELSATYRKQEEDRKQESNLKMIYGWLPDRLQKCFR